MYRIRRFGVLRTANVVALLYLVAFAIIVIPFVLFMLLAGAPRGLPAYAVGAALGGALAALLIYPILGWIATAIACLIYNFVARWAGGIEVHVERVAPPGYASGQRGYGPAYGQPSAWPSSQPPGQTPWSPAQQQQAPPYGWSQPTPTWPGPSSQGQPPSPPPPPGHAAPPDGDARG